MILKQLKCAAAAVFMIKIENFSLLENQNKENGFDSRGTGTWTGNDQKQKNSKRYHGSRLEQVNIK